MLYSQDVSRSLAGVIGSTGLAETDFQSYLDASASALETLRDHYKNETLPLLRLPERSDDISACRAALSTFQRGAEDVRALALAAPVAVNHRSGVADLSARL